MKKIWIAYLALIPLCIGFYKINELNYKKLQEIESQFVEHPEMLPESTPAKISSFGFQNVMADMYWVQSIQYIGGNVISEVYKKYLYEMLDLITDLSPSFEAPYVIGQLLLPSESQDTEGISQEEIEKNILQAEALGLKGVSYFCDPLKLENIKNENNLQKISQDSAYKNPCKSHKIPYYLAFIYYFYKHDGEKAAYYYKVTSAGEDAPSGAKVLAAIMQGKGGNREKSIYMFLSLAQSLGSPDESCTLITQKIQETYDILSQNNIALSGELIQAIEQDRDILFPALTEKNEGELLSDTSCTNYLVKAIRELTLLYLDEADIRYKKDFPLEISAKTPEKLFDAGYINFIPTDFQQYVDEDYGIIYRYNPEIGRFDYEMGY